MVYVTRTIPTGSDRTLPTRSSRLTPTSFTAVTVTRHRYGREGDGAVLTGTTLTEDVSTATVNHESQDFFTFLYREKNVSEARSSFDLGLIRVPGAGGEYLDPMSGTWLERVSLWWKRLSLKKEVSEE